MNSEQVDIEPVKVFLNGALQAHCMGNSMQYSIILQQFKIKDDPETLWKAVLALNSFTSLITQRSDTFRDLLAAIFTFDWTSDIRLTKAVLQLIINIVSCNAIFLSSAFSLFAQSFLPKNIATASMTDSITVDQTRKECTSLIHAAIQTILQQAPTGQSILVTTLYQHFPHKRFSKLVLAEYTTQLLTMCEYLPTLQYRVLDLIFQRCLEMDVEIVIEDSGDVRIQRDVDNLNTSGLGGFGGSDGEHGEGEDDVVDVYNELFAQNAGLGSDCDSALKQRIPREVFDMAEKLDALLMLIVGFLQSQLSKCTSLPTTLSALNVQNTTTASSSSSRHNKKSASTPASVDNSGNTTTPISSLERLFEHLMKIFESRLILAHKSKFVQFTLFFLTTRVPLFGEFFAQRLLALATDKSHSNVLRQASVMYLASFASRARFLSNHVVSKIVTVLIRNSTAYVLALHGEQRTASKELLDELRREFPLDMRDKEVEKHLNAHQQQLLATFSQHNNTGNQSRAFVNEVEYDEYGRLRIKAHSARQHELLYAFIQSACYILCFYGTEIAFDQYTDGLTKECWDILFTSRFDPLRYTLKSVRNEFLKLALHVQLFQEESWDCFAPDLLLVDTEFSPLPVMIHNSQRANGMMGNHNGVNEFGNRDRKGSESTALTSTASISIHSTATNQSIRSIKTQSSTYTAHSIQSTASMLGPNTLESFFPFDPCLLQRLHCCVEEYYRSWKGVPGVSEEELLRLLGTDETTAMATSLGCIDGYESPMSSLAMSLGTSLPSNCDAMMAAGRRRDRANSLNSMRDVMAAVRREKRKAIRREQQRVDDPFSDSLADEEEEDLDEVEEGDENEEDEEDDDVNEESEIEDDLHESAFAQGFEIAQPVATNNTQSSSSHGSYFAQFAAMQQQQQQFHNKKSLTAEALRALSQGISQEQNSIASVGPQQLQATASPQHSQTERRSRLYSIGSTGSW